MIVDNSLSMSEEIARLKGSLRGLKTRLEVADVKFNMQIAALGDVKNIPASGAIPSQYRRRMKVPNVYQWAVGGWFDSFAPDFNLHYRGLE